MKTKILASFAVAAMLLFSSGCTTISEHEALSRLAVQYATIKVLENNPDRAPRVVELATFVEENAGASTATSVAILRELVLEKINTERLSPADQMLVFSLVDMIAAELTARLGSGPLTPEGALVVKEVAGWIKQAALMSQ